MGRFRSFGLAASAILWAAPGSAGERLDRALIAVPSPEGVHVSWRVLPSEADRGFTLLRDGKRIATIGPDAATSVLDRSGNASSRYTLMVSGSQGTAATATPLANGYLRIPLDRPADRATPAGERYSYDANDASVGDLDGDGRFEIVLKWQPTIAKDNAFPGYSGETLLDAYTLDGKRLWRIDLGPNIRSGAHYTQFLVYDFDGDGRAEVMMKTADGTVDGTGKTLGNAKADWRAASGEVPQRDRTGAKELPDGTRVAPLVGRILNGPEYVTVFDGRTGRALASAPYSPPRVPEGEQPTTERLTELWGDGYGNRSERYLAGVATLDGKLPSAVFGRGYYARSTVAAWDWRGGKLTLRWLFDSAKPGNERFGGQGNHQLSVADVDRDGRDEIIYGSMALDDDGRGLWSTGLGHGDAMHVSDLDPARPGLEKFGVHENVRGNGGIGAAMVDARTGEVLWTKPAERDTGRGIAVDIDPRHPGAEAWASNSRDLWDAKGAVIAPVHPRAANFAVWWDGDLQRELLDGTRISKWDWQNAREVPLLAADGAASNNGTKQNPALSGDILGDWREEVVLRSADNAELRIYATPIPTEHRLPTLLADRQYREALAWQNTAYNQPPHPSFWLAGKTEAK